MKAYHRVDQIFHTQRCFCYSESMYDYKIIDSDTSWADQFSAWETNEVRSFAIDFEGEFNLHIYGEHLCLIQVFDGMSYYLIDPFKVDMKKVLPFLADPDIEKVMFDSSSDASLIYKSYGVEMKGIYDVALSASIVGFTGNLHALFEFCGIEVETVVNKKKNQMANWLIRPLKEQLISYALSDVEHLFEIQKKLKSLIQEEGKEKEEKQIQKQGTKVKTSYKPGWTKLPGYKRLGKSEKIYLRHFFLARDTLAKERNLPAYRILDKKVLVTLAKDPSKVDTLVRHRDPRMERKLLSAFEEAAEAAHKELP